MRLYEFEAKELLKKYGIPIPKGILVNSVGSINQTALQIKAPSVVKAQILSNTRGKAGGIVICNSKKETIVAANSLLGKNILNEKVTSVIIEEKADIKSEHYIAITYDTDYRTPILVIAKQGGIDVEELTARKRESITKKGINVLEGLKEDEIKFALKEAGFDLNAIEKITPVVEQLWNCFSHEDCRLLEINPLAITNSKEVIAVGALFDLDDDATYKHKDRAYAPRQAGLNRTPTERELEVKKANDVDYRGTVKYTELDGDIGVMSAGGGGSITCMDALITSGGKPSNLTEFSGNPSDEKIYVLMKAILSKPGLNGLWIVGATANFTDVHVTMQGIVKALEELQPKIPIVVRRSGPNEKEGLQLLKNASLKNKWDLECFGAEKPMTATAGIIARNAREFRLKNKK